MVETPRPPADYAEEGLEVVRNLGLVLLPERKLVVIRVGARLEGYFIMLVKAVKAKMAVPYPDPNSAALLVDR